MFGIVLLGLAVASPAVSQELNRRKLELSKPSSSFWGSDEDGASVISVSDDEAVVAGKITDRAFGIPDVDSMRLLGKNGNEIPLLVEESTIFREFGQIVSCLICFRVHATAIEKDSGAFILEWGKEVQGNNKLIQKINPPQGEDVLTKEFELREMSEGSEAGDMSVTSIDVVADSQAKYYSLWYLLPITLIFILLTLRKMALRNDSES